MYATIVQNPKERKKIYNEKKNLFEADLYPM